jgi:hypothetical protein
METFAVSVGAMVAMFWIFVLIARYRPNVLRGTVENFIAAWSPNKPAPEPPAVITKAAEIVTPPGVRYPAHLTEHRILPNDTPVYFNDDGSYSNATIGGYVREPGHGNYYLVLFNFGTGRRWVPDHYVWEKSEVAA